MADPKVSYSELEKITSQNFINYAYTPKGSPTYYSILANLPESRFSKDEWEKLVKEGQKPTWETAFDQIGGVNERDDKSPFGDVIRSQNVTLFKLFVDIKKKKFKYKFADERKAALTINRKSGGNDEIKDILKDDSYFDK